MINPDLYAGGDSAALLDRAAVALPPLLAAFQQGDCNTRRDAYRALTDTLLPAVTRALDVLQDCHDDGCPDCDAPAAPVAAPSSLTDDQRIRYLPPPCPQCHSRNTAAEFVEASTLAGGPDEARWVPSTLDCHSCGLTSYGADGGTLAGETFYVLECHDCDDGLRMPFPTAAARGRWATDHAKATDHRSWTVRDIPALA